MKTSMMLLPAFTVYLTTLVLGTAKQIRLKRASGSSDTTRVTQEPFGRHLYQPTLDGEKQMVFTHQINVPPQSCSCPDRSLVRTLLSRLEALEAQVMELKQKCPGRIQQGADVQAPCGQHGRFDEVACRCQCDVGWKGPTCSESSCPSACHGHGTCVDGSCVCQDGFMGESCEEIACPDDCNDQGRCMKGRCICFRGYTGTSCGDPSCPGDCGSHGRCIQDICVCEEGYSGPDCSTKVCPENCRNHGRCVNGECICDAGFTGPNCGTKTCPENCWNQGQCFDGECICDPGFTGPDCRTKSCPENCRNHGQCVNGKCVCDAGFTGPDCATKSCPENCRNRGRCVNGKCVCIAGFAGPDCGVRACPENCRNHGQCVNGKCVCNPGYAGISCGNRMCPDNCSKRGRCINGHCICDTGFTGPNCGTRTCPDNCMDRGECTDGHCICDTGFTGLNCGTRTCPDNCMDQGECTDGRCICDTGFTGPNCGTRTCPDNCMDRGECTDGRCICDTGFTGPNCGTRTCPDNCMDRGECTDGRCICDTGFTGLNCGTRTCPDNCMDRGECTDGRCICDTGFTGLNCGTRTCPDNCMDQGECTDGRCVCDTGFTGSNCGTRTCPDNCMERGECTDGRCICDMGFTGLNCDTRTCPDNCKNHGQCVDGRCLCKPGFTGYNCGSRTCPNNCSNQGRCENGKCVCDVGYFGPVCGNKACLNNCTDRGRCLKGICQCRRGYTGPDCGEIACPNQCSQRGTCQDGQCLCAEGYSGKDCSEEIPAVGGLVVKTTEETSVTMEWSRPHIPVDGYEISFTPMKEENGILHTQLSGTATDFHQRGLAPGQEYTVAIKARKGQVLGPETTKTFTTPIDAPKALRPTDITPSTITLQWERSVAYVDLYLITYISTDGEQRRVEVPATEDHVVLKDLDSAVEYYITVVAQRAREESKPVSIEATTEDEMVQGTLSANPIPETTSEIGWVVESQPTSKTPKATTKVTVTQTVPPGRWPTGRRPSLTTQERVMISTTTREESPKAVASERTPSPEDGARREGSQKVVAPGKEILSTTDERVVTTTIRREGSETMVPPRKRPVPNKEERLVTTNITTEGLPGEKTPAKRPSVITTKKVVTTVITRWESRTEGSQEERVPPTDEETVVTVISENPPLTKKDRMVTAEVTEEEPQDVGPQGKKPTHTKEEMVVIAKPLLVGKIPPLTKEESGVTDTITEEEPQHGARGKKPPHTKQEIVIIANPLLVGSQEKISPLTKEERGDPATNTKKDPQRPVEKRPVVPSEKRKSPTKENILDTSQEKPEKKDPIKKENSTAKVEKDPANYTISTGGSAKVLIKTTPLEGLLLKNMIHNISSKLSSFNGTLLQRLESYLKASSYPLRENQTIKTVAKSIFLYLVHKKPPHITQEVYNRLMELTLEDNEKAQPRPTQIKIFSGPVEEYGDSEEKISQENTSKKPKVVSGGDQSGLSPVGNLAESHIEEERSAPKASQERDYRPSSLHPSRRVVLTTGRPDLKKHSRPEVLSRTSTSIVISLDGLKGHSSNVVINYKDIASTDPGHQLVLPGDAKTAKIPGLIPGTAYRVDLHGILRGQSSKSYSIVASTAPGSRYNLTTGQEPPLPPSEVSASAEVPDVIPEPLGALSVANSTSGGLNISWSATPGAFRYFVIRYRDSAAPTPEEVHVPGDQHSTELTYLIPGTEYEIQLNGVVQGQPTSPLTTRVLTAPPGPRDHLNHLGDLTVENIEKTRFRLAWKARKGAYDSFLVRYEDTAGQLGPQETSVLGDLRTMVVRGLNPDTEYAVTLYGVYNGFLSRPLKTAVKTAPPEDGGIKPRVVGLSASDVTGDSVRLSWTVLDGDFDFFILQYKDQQGQTQEQMIRGDLTSTIVKGLLPSQNYTFILYGISDDKRSEPVSIEVTTVSPDHQAALQPQLGVLSVSDVTENSLRLSWTVQAGEFDSFLLQYRDSEGKTKALRIRGALRTATISSLHPAWTYKFNLYGVAAKKHSKPISVEGITASAEKPAVPPALGDLSVSDITEDSLQLSWTVQGRDFDSFLIMYRDSEGRTQKFSVTGDERKAIVSGLAPETNYKFHLYGISSDAHSKPKSIEATTAVALPKKILPSKASLGDLSISEVTEDSLRLTWTVQNGEFDSFLIQYRDVEGKPHTVPLSGEVQSTIISGLKPSKKYKFSLYGVLDNKRGKPVSAEATTVSPKKTLSQKASLEDLSISNITEDSLQLFWTVQDGEFDSFLIQYKDAEGKPQEVPISGELQTTIISGLKPSKKYKFSLYGILDNKRSKPVSAEATTALPKKAVIQKASLGDLSISDISEDSLRLFWTVQDGEFDSFLIQYKDAEGKPLDVQVDGDLHYIIISGLKPSKKYKFNLYGLLNNKRSKAVAAEATTASVKKTALQKASLGDLSISDITEDSLRLSWTVQDGNFDSFVIMYRNADGDPQEVAVDGEIQSTVISGLKPSKKYKFNLYGISDNKRSKPISAEAITVSEKKTMIQKATLGDLSISNITEDSLQLSWTVQDGEFDSFFIQYRDAEGKPLEVQVDGELQTTTISGLKPEKKYKFNLYGILNNKRSKPLSTEATTASPKTMTQKATLGDLSISNITEDALQLSWTVQDGEFDSFLIQSRDEEGKTLEASIDGELHTTTISDLEPSKKYNFNLYGILNHKHSTPVSAEATTASSKTVTQKATLEGLSISNITEDTLWLSWTVQDGEFDSFLIQYSNEEGKILEVPVDGELHTTIITGLEPSKKYSFNLYGVLNNKHSTPVSAEVTTAPLKAVTEKATLGDLSISHVTEDSLHLTWTVQDGEFDSFLIQYSDEERKTLEVPVDRELHTTIITGLEPSKKYKFNLYGVLNSKYSTPVSSEATTASPKIGTQKATLGDLSISNITEDSLQLSWTVQDGEFDSFLIQYSDEEEHTLEVPVDGKLQTTIISSLEPSKKYIFHLYGVLNNERSIPVSAEITTASKSKMVTKVSILGDLSASDITEDSLQLSWTVQDGMFDSFLIQYKDVEEKLQEVPVNGELQTALISGLKPSKKYKFNLYGVLANQKSKPVSTEATTVKKMTTQKAILGDLSISNITEDSLQLSWTVQDGNFDSFLIFYKNADGTVQEVPIDGELRTTIITGLKPSKKYKFNFYGVSDNKRSKPVSAEATTVSPKKTVTLKATLGDLSISNITEDSLQLSWTVQDGEFDSFLIQYKDMEGKPQEASIDGAFDTTTISGLKPSKKYKFNLYGILDNKRSKPVSAEATTASPHKTVTQKPTLGDLSISDITEDSVRLSWTVKDGAFDSFLIQYRDMKGKPLEVPIDGDFDTTIISGLEPSKKYKFSLFGVLDNKRSKPMSAEVTTASTEKTSAQQPQLKDLSVSDITDDSLHVSWTTHNGNFDSFLLLYRDHAGRAQKVPVAGGERSITITGLAPDMKVKFYLHGISGNTRSKPLSLEASTASLAKSTPGPPQLRDLTVSSITDDSLKLSWIVQDGEFDSFIIQYRNADGDLQEVPVDRYQSDLIILGLQPAKKYKFNLYGIIGDRRSQPISVDAITALPVKSAPWLKDFSVSNITENSLQLSWTIQDGEFNSFVIQYRDAEGKPREVPVLRNDNTATISSLKPAKKYKFMLYGIYENKRSKPISTEATTASLEKPLILPRLGDLLVSDVTKDSLLLSWTVEDGNFDSFVVQYKDSEDGIHEVPISGKQRFTTILGLLPSHKYKFNLYGISGDRRSKPKSAEATTAFPEAIGQQAAMLDDLHISDVGSNSVQLSWEAPDNSFDSFLIQYGVSPDMAPKREKVVAGDLRKILLGGLHPNTEYNFTLSGIRAGQMRASLNTIGRTSRLELEAPQDLQITNITETSAAVTWTPPLASVDRYKVSFQLAHGGEPLSHNVEGGKTKTTLTGLVPGAHYEVSIMALRGFEESEPLIGFLTAVPDGPTDLRAVNVGDSSALLLWKPALAAVDSYVVAYGAENVPTVTKTVSGSSSSLPLSSLKVDTEYKVQIHGTRGSNSSSPASTSFTTGADAPRDLTASEVTPRSAVLSWTAPQAAPTAYILTYETPTGDIKEVKLAPSLNSYELTDLFSATQYQARLQAVRGGVRTAPTSTSFTTGRLRYPFPRDCVEEYLNGFNRSRPATIFLGGDQKQPLKVFCDMETDGGGWIVFQRRMNGKTDFWRDWEEYATGFGNLTQEFWLGNNNLHRLTSQGAYELRVDLRAGSESVYALYDYFRVEPESKYYRLRLGKYSGSAGDSLSYHSGSVFSTRDRDYNRQILPCAVSYRGAWWYRNCHYSNLNGMYSHSKDHQGITWYNWKGFEFSIPFTEMKLRPRSAGTPLKH